MLRTSSEPPAYSATSASTSAAITAATDDLRRRQEELDQKAVEIEQRERNLQQTTQAIGVYVVHNLYK